MARRSKVRAKDILTTSLMLAGTAAIGASVYITFIAGVGTREAGLVSGVQEKKAEVQELTEMRRQEGVLRSALEKSSTLVTPIWARATDSNQSAEEMLCLLYESAIGSRVAIESARHKIESSVNAFFDVTGYDVAAVGDYHQFGHFLHAMEGGPWLVRIRTLKIAAQKDGRARATFDLYFYTLRQPAGGET